MIEFFNNILNGWHSMYINTADFVESHSTIFKIVIVLLALFILFCMIWLQFRLMGKKQIITTTTLAKVDPLASLHGANAPTIIQEKPATKKKWGLNSVSINYALNNGLEMTLIQPILEKGWEPFCIDNNILYFRMEIVSEKINP